MEVKKFIPWDDKPEEVMTEEYANSLAFLQKVGKAIMEEVLYKNNEYLELDTEGHIDILRTIKEIIDIFTLGMAIPEEIAYQMPKMKIKEFSDDFINSIDWYERLKNYVTGDPFMIVLEDINWDPVIRWSKIYQVVDIHSEDCGALFWETTGRCIVDDPDDIKTVFMY